MWGKRQADKVTFARGSAFEDLPSGLRASGAEDPACRRQSVLPPFRTAVSRQARLASLPACFVWPRAWPRETGRLTAEGQDQRP